MSFKIGPIGFLGYCWNSSCLAYQKLTHVGVALSWMQDYRWGRWRCCFCLANLRTD